MKKMLFIYNPNAGRGLIKTKLADILDVFVKADYEVVVYPTQARQDAYHKVQQMKNKYDIVVCSGGDGTLDEVVTGMMKREKKVPIGYIPTGTTNDFANSIRIPKDMLKAADIAVHGEKFACDMGTFNDDVFVYVAAFGLFTDVTYQTDQNIKKVLGHAAYVLEGVRQLSNIPTYLIEVEHDGERFEDEFMLGMVTNSKSVGGMKGLTGKEIRFDDGEFEVMLIRRPKNLIELQEIVTAILNGTFISKHMYAFKAKEISFKSDIEIPWTLDGEFGGQPKFVQIRNMQKALEIMVKPKKKEKEKG